VAACKRLPVRCQCLYCRGCWWSPANADLASRARLSVDPGACTCAALRGQLGVLTYLRASGCPWDSDTIRAAVRRGHQDVLMWARANGCPWGSLTCARTRVLMGAAHTHDLGDRLEAVEHFYGETPFVAQRPEKIEAVVEWLRANGCPESGSETDSESD
jgi:hypothetical protein